MTCHTYTAGGRLFEPVSKDPPNPLEASAFLNKVTRGFKKTEVPQISLRILAEEEISQLTEAYPHVLQAYPDGSVMPDTGRVGSAALHPHSGPP